MLKRVNSKRRGIKCGICNGDKLVFAEHNKVCLNCYFGDVDKIPKHIPFEQHDLWIISYHKKEQKGIAI